MTAFTLAIPGPPAGKARPRFVRATGRTYTPDTTVRAEDRVRNAWHQAGRPWLGDGPLAIHVEVVVARPRSHYRVNGELSAAGVRATRPTRKPDLDNVLKLLADSMNGCAFKDDAQIVQASLCRRWAARDEREHVLVGVSTVDAGGVHTLGAAA